MPCASNAALNDSDYLAITTVSTVRVGCAQVWIRDGVKGYREEELRCILSIGQASPAHLHLSNELVPVPVFMARHGLG